MEFYMFNKASFSLKIVAIAIATTFVSTIFFTDFLRLKDAQASTLKLPTPAKLLLASDAYSLPLFRGIRINPENPLNFNFIIDKANADKVCQEEAITLVNYFLAGLTTPIEDIWVNLSPYENDRIIQESLGVTDMGRDMLAQDYVLKQLSSSLTHPDTKVGKKYWSLLSNNQSEFSSENESFSKVWIIPDIAQVKEDNGLAIITKSSLKVMTESDYLAIEKNAFIGANESQSPTDNSKIMRNIIVPEIEKDVNYGKNFANLRQIYNSLILSVWFKRKFEQSFFQHYINKNKVNGIDIADKQAKDKIFDLYVQAFKKGAYNTIKKEYDPQNHKTVKRRYFSGGENLGPLSEIMQNSHSKINEKMILSSSIGDPIDLTLNLRARTNKSSSSIKQRLENFRENLNEIVENSGLMSEPGYDEYSEPGKIINHIKTAPNEPNKLLLAILDYLTNDNTVKAKNYLREGYANATYTQKLAALYILSDVDDALLPEIMDAVGDIDADKLMQERDKEAYKLRTRPDISKFKKNLNEIVKNSGFDTKSEYDENYEAERILENMRPDADGVKNLARAITFYNYDNSRIRDNNFLEEGYPNATATQKVAALYLMRDISDELIPELIEQIGMIDSNTLLQERDSEAINVLLDFDRTEFRNKMLELVDKSGLDNYEAKQILDAIHVNLGTGSNTLKFAAFAYMHGIRTNEHFVYLKEGYEAATAKQKIATIVYLAGVADELLPEVMDAIGKINVDELLQLHTNASLELAMNHKLIDFRKAMQEIAERSGLSNYDAEEILNAMPVRLGFGRSKLKHAAFCYAKNSREKDDFSNLKEGYKTATAKQKIAAIVYMLDTADELLPEIINAIGNIEVDKLLDLHTKESIELAMNPKLIAYRSSLTQAVERFGISMKDANIILRKMPDRMLFRSIFYYHKDSTSERFDELKNGYSMATAEQKMAAIVLLSDVADEVLLEIKDAIGEIDSEKLLADRYMNTEETSSAISGGVDLKTLEQGIAIDSVSSAFIAMPAPFDITSFDGFEVEFVSLKSTTAKKILAKSSI